MQVEDRYVNRKNPERMATIRAVEPIVGKVAFLIDGDDQIHERSISTFEKSWKSVQAATYKEVEPERQHTDIGISSVLSQSDAMHVDPAPSVALDATEVPGEDCGDPGDECETKPGLTHICYDDISDEDAFDDITLEFKGNEGRMLCKCGQAYLISKGCSGRHFDEKKDEFVSMHLECLRKKEVQKKLFGRESVASGANGEAVA